MVSDASYRLDCQTGIVVGGAGGIGQVLALGLADAGSNVVVADLASRQEDAEAVAESVRSKGRRALALPIDVTDVRSIEQVADQVVATFGAIDWMVDCAGVNIRKPVLDYNEREWDLMVDINLKGTFFCTQIVARQMALQKHGRIVNIASQLAVVAMPERSIYAITKAGVAHMTKAFAIELASAGGCGERRWPNVCVNALDSRHVHGSRVRQ